MTDPFGTPAPRKPALFNVRVTRARAFAVVLVLAVAGCGGAAFAGKPGFQKRGEETSNQIATAAFQAVPYPMAAVKAGGFLERRNLAERLKRFSDPNKLGYVYLLSGLGKFIGYYAIKGKVSSTQSQMTNPTQTWDEHGSGSGHSYGQQVPSIGDDGSYGENEPGVFFFTTGGVMVETDVQTVYVDKPLDIGNVPQLYR